MKTKFKKLFAQIQKWTTIKVLFIFLYIKYTGVWFANFWYVFISPTSKPRIFKGFFHWWLAKTYADKRAKLTQVNKLCGGKRHYVLPYSNEGLLVINRLELINGKERGLLNKNLNINKILTNAYYITK
jgi:hypothetical protein